MDRRQLLRSGALLAAPASLSGCSGRLDPRFADWRTARDTVFELLFKTPRLEGSRWNLPQMLQHAAQSIEFSMQGFPEMKSAAFRRIAGNAAFAFFNARGAMSHTLDEPIPAAPPLDAEKSLKGSVERLLAAMDAFAKHPGQFAPHFAYGELTREQYERAHLMHLANHWQQLHQPK